MDDALALCLLLRGDRRHAAAARRWLVRVLAEADGVTLSEVADAAVEFRALGDPAADARAPLNVLRSPVGAASLAAMTGRPRLVIALVVSMMLVAFGGYTLLAGSSQLLVSVAQLRANTDGAAHQWVQLTGTVLSASGDQSPLRFVLRDDSSLTTTVAVAYAGSVPDAFKVGRHVIVTGRLQHGTFVAQRDSLLTKCPSKYSAGGGGA